MSLCCGILTVPACGLKLTPRLQLHSENLHLQHHRLLHRAPSNTQPAKGKNVAKAALVKRNTATCRRKIYQLLLNVVFLEESNCYLLPHNQGQLHFHNFWHRTATWIYYKTIPLEQPGVKCFVQGHSDNDSSRGSNHQTTISHHHQNTILQEENPDHMRAHDLFRCTKVKLLLMQLKVWKDECY